jgi:hypothetical protein
MLSSEGDEISPPPPGNFVTNSQRAVPVTVIVFLLTNPKFGDVIFMLGLSLVLSGGAGIILSSSTSTVMHTLTSL